MEWCEDRYGDYEKEAVTDPTGAATGRLRVLRGGYWRLFPGFCRSANRGRCAPDDRNGYGGFRVVVDFK